MPTRQKRKSEETELSNAIRQALTAKGCRVIRVNSGLVEAKNGGWVHGAPTGTPDLICVRPRTSITPYARITFIEVKKKTGKRSAAQLEWQTWADLEGAHCVCVRSISEAIDAVFGDRKQGAA